MPPTDENRYLPRREWPDYLKTTHGFTWSPKTFAKAATVGGGPRYVLFGGRAYSTPAWLSKWALEKLSAPRHSTSEAA